jgi:predicted nucleic acid-binding protein
VRGRAFLLDAAASRQKAHRDRIPAASRQKARFPAARSALTHYPQHNVCMTRFVIDAAAAIRLAREKRDVHDSHKLVAPTLLRSQALSLVYQAARRRELTNTEAHAILDAITTMRIRLLGDRVSRTVAWQVADHFDWDDTADAEYVAVTRLQADALITLDAALAAQVDGFVTVAPFEALFTP